MNLEPILKKLRYKEEFKACVINAPEYLSKFFQEAGLSTNHVSKESEFTLLFIEGKADFDKLFEDTLKKLAYDSVFWICYPKGSSKKYKSDINRDSLWAATNGSGYRPVSAVAIDADWSALRYRPEAEVKSK